MSTITTINGTDVISTSRTTINTNFSNLNTDKIETSYLDTDTALTANSDSKIATQKAVKAYVDAGGNQNASTTQRGIVEEATSAEMIAGTGAGGSGARLFINPTLVAETGADKIVKTKSTGLLDSSIIPVTLPTAKVLIPRPVVPLNPQATQMGVLTDWSVDTTMQVGLIEIPFAITVNKVSVRTGTMTGAMTIDIQLYSEDGQTKTNLVVDGSIANTEDDTIHTFSVSAISVAAGNYYLAFNVVDATGGQLAVWNTDATIPFSTTAGLAEDVSSEPILQGTIAISSGTPPSTITPTSITPADDKILIIRLDN